MGRGSGRGSGGGQAKLAKRNAATSRGAAQPPLSSTAPDSASAIDAQSRADPADAPSRASGGGRTKLAKRNAATSRRAAQPPVSSTAPDSDSDLPDLVASSSSEGDSSEEEHDCRRMPVFVRAPLARRRIAQRSARPRVRAGREGAGSAAGPLRRPAQGLFLAGTGRNLDGIAVLGAAFGSPEDDPNDNAGSPGHWERSMRPDDTVLDEIEEESPAAVQVAGPDSNTLDNQDAGASGHKESASSDGSLRSLS